MFTLIALAFAGGIVSALAGWANSAEPFNSRKFLKSGIAALIAGGAWALSMADTAVTARMMVLAFLAGAGVDVLSNRALSVLAKR